ncbi:MAG: YceI family protein [Novosphingobium sp.]|uniref:YceI family protein n=1 Tax=Novosphingobium sp. TaxID=1874826 RepID=UPI0032BBD0A2
MAALASLAAAPPAYRYQLDNAHSTVTAKVSYLGVGSKTARFPVMKGAIRITPDRLGEIDLYVELDARALDAGSKGDTAQLRGKDFFDVARHPAITFTGQRMTMNGPVSARLDGTITARGISRPASLAVTFRDPPARASGRDPVQLRATTTINRREFGMNAYGWAIGKTVKITIDARLMPS